MLYPPNQLQFSKQQIANMKICFFILSSMIMAQQVSSVSYHSFEKTPEQWKKMEQQQKKIVRENTTQGQKHKPCGQKQEKEEKEKSEKALWWRLLLIIILFLK